MDDRNNYQKHTTRRAIIRADFLALNDDLIEKIKNQIRISLKDERGIFDKCQNSVLRKYELEAANFNPSELKDSRLYLEANEESSIKVFECFKYINDTQAYKLAICDSSCSFEINQDIDYKPFEKYRDIIKEALSIVKDVAKDSFSLTRIGVRKMNDIILDAEANLEEYIENELFGYKLPSPTEEKVNFSERKYIIKEDESINVNYFTTYLTGRIKMQQIQRIAFDIDVYSTENDFLRATTLNLGESMNWLEDLNAIIFKYFKLSLQTSFKEKLKSESALADEHVIAGVLDNEQ